jgi:hypothetical protein
MGRSNTYENLEHVLGVAVFIMEDGDLDYEIDVFHPIECRVDEDLAHCPLDNEIMSLGSCEALFGYPWKDAIELPINHLNDVWQQMANALDRVDEGDEVQVHFGVRWSGGENYWGEWDEDLTIWVLDLPKMVDDAIERWHMMPLHEFIQTNLSLNEYLGWTWDEYKAHVEKGIIPRPPKEWA